MIGSRIPIANIYYLLCYAWDKIEERDTVAVDPIEGGHIADLLGKVLATGTAHLLRRGLDRGYVPVSEDARSVRGRIVFSQCVKRQLLASAMVHVEYDELSHDVLHNRILRSTLRRLVRSNFVDDAIRDECRDVERRMGDIGETELSPLTFRSMQFRKETGFYEFLIRVCEMLVHGLLPSEQEGEGRFRDFEQDDQRMAGLFEEFVRGFYKREQDEYRVSSQIIAWAATPANEASAALLPRMRTDVSLISGNRHLVIDTKFYRDALRTHYDTERLREMHLYQMHAYMTNLQAVNSASKISGMLLYPQVTAAIDASYDLMGRHLRVTTVDLTAPWQEIHSRLLSLIAD